MPEFLPVSKKEADALDYPVYHAIYRNVTQELKCHGINADEVPRREDTLVSVCRVLLLERGKWAARRLVDRLSRS